MTPPFDQIPEIPVEVFEHRNSAVRLVLRRPYKDNSLRLVAFVVSPETVRVEEQEYTTARLLADTRLLLRSRCPGQQKARLEGAGWFDRSEERRVGKEC